MPSDDYDINPTRMTVSEPGVMPQDREAESSVLSAMMIFVDKLVPNITEDMDLIGFTHFLNRVAIQHCFDKSDEEE